MKNTIANNSIFNFLTQLLVFLTGTITSVVIARVLGPARMGDYSYYLWVLSIIATFVSLGIPITITRFIAKYNNNSNPHIAKSIASKLITIELILTSFAATLITIFTIFGYYEGDRLSLIIILATVPFVVSNSIFLAVLQGQQKFAKILQVNILVSLVNLSLVLIYFLLKIDIIGLLLLNLIITLVSSTLLYSRVRGFFKPNNEKLSKAIVSEMVRYFISSSVVIILDLIVWQRSEIFFLKIYSTGEQIAYYSLAYGLVSKVMTMLPGAISGVIMPRFANYHGTNEDDKISHTFQVTTRYLMFITIPIVAVGIVLCTNVVNIVYGDVYDGTGPVLRILLISGGFGTVVAAASAVLYGVGQQSFIIKTALLIAIINITLDLLLIKQFGAVGAAMANSISQIIGAVIGFVYIVRVKKMRFPTLSFAKILIGTAVSTVALLCLLMFINGEIFEVVLGIVVFAILYLTTLNFLKYYNENDIDLFNRYRDMFISKVKIRLP